MANKKYIIVGESPRDDNKAIFYNTNSNSWEHVPDFTSAVLIGDAIMTCKNMHKGFIFVENKAATHALRKMGVDIRTATEPISVKAFLEHAKSSDFIVVENPNGDFIDNLYHNPNHYTVNIPK